MILDLGEDAFYRNSYLIGVDEVPVFDDIVGRAKVRPGTYSWELVRDMYISIFVRSLDLNHDFEMFYAVEYLNFEDYLRRKVQFSQFHSGRAVEYHQVFKYLFYCWPRHGFLGGGYGGGFLADLLNLQLVTGEN